METRINRILMCWSASLSHLDLLVAIALRTSRISTYARSMYTRSFYMTCRAARVGSHWLSNATNGRLLFPFISRIASARDLVGSNGVCGALRISRLNSDRLAARSSFARAFTLTAGLADLSSVRNFILWCVSLSASVTQTCNFPYSQIVIYVLESIYLKIGII